MKLQLKISSLMRILGSPFKKVRNFWLTAKAGQVNPPLLRVLFGHSMERPDPIIEPLCDEAQERERSLQYLLNLEMDNWYMLSHGLPRGREKIHSQLQKRKKAQIDFYQSKESVSKISKSGSRKSFSKRVMNSLPTLLPTLKKMKTASLKPLLREEKTYCSKSSDAPRSLDSMRKHAKFLQTRNQEWLRDLRKSRGTKK